ncbi:MAG: DUF115 domain-containing protein [Sulfurimonas sp.]|jgi:hypothetical protein|nr:DUF115 domain-containing protein [Sulfurimonas sp.]
MQFFQINLEALQDKNKELAKRLLEISEVKNFEIFMDNEDINTLNFVHTQHFIPLYDGSPALTLQTQIQEYEKFAKYPYLFFYGIANGVLLKHLLQNENHKRIIVIEPELEILYVVLHMIDFSAALRDGRLVLFDAQSVDFPSLIGYFLKYEEHKYARTYELQMNTHYYEKLYFEHMQHSNRVIIEAIYHSVNIAGNDTVDALIGLKHHIGNLAKLLETPPLFELMQKVHTCDTAVLVSTGPSLTKQLPLLKKIAPYVRIIAVDASFPVLYRAGIKPDVVVSIERVKESARFFSETPKQAFDDVVFALSSVQHKDVVQSIKGGVMQMSLRPLGFMMYTGPDEWGYIGIGQSAANMAYELIYHAKFKNCILIGQDLAYGEDGTSHADGHVFGQENVKTKETDVWIKGWQGKTQVRTNHTWDMFRKSFEKDIGDTKVNMLTINATEGGASIYGTLEVSFAEAIERYVDTKVVKSQLILQRAAAFERERVAKNTWQKVERMRTYVEELLELSKTVFLDVAKTLEQEMSVYSVEELQHIVVQAQAIKARYNEEIYDKVAWHIAQSTMLSKEIELAPAEVYIAKDEADEKERLWHLLERYKPWLFHFAGIMDAIIKTIDYAKVRRLIDSVQTIDIYCEDEKIDSFGCSDMKAEQGRVFDVDMRGILYDVPDAYQEKIDAICFKDAKTSEELPQAFVDVIRRDDEKYNELSFMKSLEEPIDEEKIRDLYCPNAIGFLATEENLEDEEFVGYINQIMNDFPKTHFKALVFNQNSTINIKEKFNQESLEVVMLSNIIDIFNNLEVYLSNNDRNKFDTNILLWLRKHSLDVFCIGLSLNQKNIAIKTHELNNQNYFQKFFENIEYLGFLQQDIEKYGNTFHETYFKKACDIYGVDMEIDMNETISKAHVYWTLKLGLSKHDFFRYALEFGRKFAKL